MLILSITIGVLLVIPFVIERVAIMVHSIELKRRASMWNELHAHVIVDVSRRRSVSWDPYVNDK